MIAKIQHPLVAAGLGLALSLAVGIGTVWRPLTQLLTQATQRALAIERSKQPEPIQRKGWDFWTIEMDNLSNELKEERARLRQQAEALELRAARIAAEEKEFEKVRIDVELLRREISDRVIEIAVDETKNIRSLAQTYANLTPRAAVAIIRELDDTTAVKILSVMKPDTVGPIFEEMSKTAADDIPLARRAAVLSEKLRLIKANKPASP